MLFKESESQTPRNKGIRSTLASGVIHMCRDCITESDICHGKKEGVVILRVSDEKVILLSRLIGHRVHLKKLQSRGKTMKNVLFTTTAVAALAFGGTAFAAGHSSGNFGISGSTDVGYNDDIEGGIFAETNIDVKASKDAGNGVTVSGHARLNFDLYEDGDLTTAGEQFTNTTSIELKNVTVETGVGKLEFADSFDGTGASDTFYKDRDGMQHDMQNGDGLTGLKWSGDMGNFGYAIDAGDLENNIGDDWSIGLGGDFGPASVGFGYENNNHGGNGTQFGLSGDFSAGIADIGLSYIDNDNGNSIGVAASAEITPGVTVGAYYAVNDPNADAFGVSLDYANGPFTLAVDWDDNGSTTNTEVDVSYDMGNGVVGYVGWDEADGYYVGAEVDIADGVKATVAYAEADEIGGPEFKQGTSAFLSLTY